jgi:hypothetical protein
MPAADDLVLMNGDRSDRDLAFFESAPGFI